MKFQKVISLILFFFGCFMLCVFILTSINSIMVKQSGILVLGVVTKAESTPVSDAPNSNLHVFECQYNDSIYTFKVVLNKISYKSKDSVAFWFDPKNPERTIILKDDPDWFNKWLALLLGMGTTIFGFWIWKVPKDKLIRMGEKLSNFFDSMGLKG